MKTRTINLEAKLIHTDEDLPLDVYETHYSFRIYCENCDQFDGVMIKKGIKAKGLSTTCTNCGCAIKL